MAGTIQVDNGFKTFTAGEDLSAFRRVKLDTTVNQVIYADAEHDSVGITQGAVDSGDPVNLKLRTAEGTVKVEAAGVVTLGDIVYGADDGKIDDDPSGVVFGQAINASGADGDIIEVIPGVEAHSDLLNHGLVETRLSCWICYISNCDQNYVRVPVAFRVSNI